MKRFWTFMKRCAAFRRRDEAEVSLREEIEAHLEMETEALVAEGLEPARAREEARRRFGHVEGLKEQCREQSRLVWLEQWGRDVAHSVRALLRLKGYSLSVILVLALGIASLATVLNIAQQLLYPATPFFAPERTMEIQAVFAPGSSMFLQQEQYLKLSTRTESHFECWAAHTYETENMLLGGVPFPLSHIKVTPLFLICAGCSL